MRKLLFILLLCLILATSATAQFFAPNQKPMLGLQVNKAHPLGDAIAVWLFNEASGNKVSDLSGNGNDGTLLGGDITWVPGRFGSALKFPGSAGDYLSLPLLKGTSLDGPFAFSYWCNVPNTPWNTVRQLCFGLSTNENKLQTFCNEGVGGPTTYQCDIHVAWGGVTLLSDNNCVHNVWEHVVITRDAANLCRMYINGQVQADTETKAGTIDSTYHQFGRFGASDTHIYSGKLDILSIYNRALSASEIGQLYAKPFCFMEPSFNWMLYGGISVTPSGQVIFINMN